MEDLSPYPKRIARILTGWHVEGVTPEDCSVCSSSCCSYGGFAILENVLAIFDVYQRGELKREDYVFPVGLSFRDFVGTHFDVIWFNTGQWLWRRRIAAFYMKSLSSDGHLISIPYVGKSYYQTRAELFRDNPWLNKGCIFLNKKVDPPLIFWKTPRAAGDFLVRFFTHAVNTNFYLHQRRYIRKQLR